MSNEKPFPSSPYLIGLTGNIATGKSTVARMLAQRGAEVIDADRVAHAVMEPDGPAYAEIIRTFGRNILTPDGRIDRQALGAIVFRDAEALRRLEAIVHPHVMAAIGRRIAASRAPVVVVEAIKLLESPAPRPYDAIWVTTCPSELQLQRLIRLRGMGEEAARRRIEAQGPQEAKLRHADVVIHTEGSLEETEAQVARAWAELPSPQSRSSHSLGAQEVIGEDR